MEYSLRDKKGGKGKSFKEFILTDGTELGIFQGSRGFKPELDIIIKFQQKGKNVRTPAHIHWVIDLIRKEEHDKKLTLEFVKYLRDMYDRVEPFKDKKEQQNCELKETTREKLRKFESLNQYGEYSVEFIGHLIELMIKMEKNHPNPSVFKKLMDTILNKNTDIFSIAQQAIQKRR